MHLISGRTDGRGGANRTPAKLNLKPGPLPSLYFGIYILLVSVDYCCFLRFSECFPVISVFFYRHSTPDLLLFLNYFLSVSQWAPFRLVSPWLKPLVTSLHLIKAWLYCR